MTVAVSLTLVNGQHCHVGSKWVGHPVKNNIKNNKTRWKLTVIKGNYKNILTEFHFFFIDWILTSVFWNKKFVLINCCSGFPQFSDYKNKLSPQTPSTLVWHIKLTLLWLTREPPIVYGLLHIYIPKCSKYSRFAWSRSQNSSYFW